MSALLRGFRSTKAATADFEKRSSAKQSQFSTIEECDGYESEGEESLKITEFEGAVKPEPAARVEESVLGE